MPRAIFPTISACAPAPCTRTRTPCNVCSTVHSTPYLVGGVLARVDGQHLGRHARVPQLDDAVRVARRQQAAQHVERRRVAAVVVAVVRLRAQPGARVPHADGLVAAGRRQVGREGHPRHVVDRVDVAAQRHAALAGRQVPQAHGVVEAAAGQHLAQVVEAHAPHRLLVVREGRGAALLLKVPHLRLSACACAAGGGGALHACAGWGGGGRAFFITRFKRIRCTMATLLLACQRAAFGSPPMRVAAEARVGGREMHACMPSRCRTDFTAPPPGAHTHTTP